MGLLPDTKHPVTIYSALKKVQYQNELANVLHAKEGQHQHEQEMISIIASLAFVWRVVRKTDAYS